MRVCDTSLEPSWTPYERKAPAQATTLRTRPQCSKMCFLLHKLACNGHFETQTLKKSYIWYQNNDLANMAIDLLRSMRPQCVKKHTNVILHYTAPFNDRFCISWRQAFNIGMSFALRDRQTNRQIKLEYRWAPKTVVESNRILPKGSRAPRGFREVSEYA